MPHSAVLLSDTLLNNGQCEGPSTGTLWSGDSWSEYVVCVFFERLDAQVQTRDFTNLVQLVNHRVVGEAVVVMPQLFDAAPALL